MRLLILGGSNSRNSGGVFDTARMMGLQLHQANHIDVEYLMFDDEYSTEDKKYYTPLPVHSYAVKGPRKLGFSPDLYEKIKSIKPDIVHTQSLWMYLSYANKKYHTRTGTPYMISPHGMLDQWQLKQSFWKNMKKSIVLGLYEKDHLSAASCFHALCKEEHDSIRALGFNNPIAIIPNGIHLPNERKGDNINVLNRQKGGKKQLLFLARIHPKKGLDNLLEGWALTQPSLHDWQLVIAGETKDDQYMQSLTDRTNRLMIANSVSFVGGRFGKAKHELLSNCDAFILPSFSEGLPMSVLESWSYQLPALITPYCNLPVGYEKKCAIRIDTNPDSISDGIRQLIALNTGERKKMGTSGFELVRDKFSWAQVANDMNRLYDWILGKNDKPEFVYS